MAEESYVVTVPYYSAPSYLDETLRSVLAQTDPRWCCIVVDDSPDGGAAEVVAGLGDPRIELARNDTTLGVAGNFNRCVELAVASGAELGMILHGDDLLEPWYVATMRAAHARHPDAAAVAPRVTVIDASGRSYLPLPDRVKGWLWPRRVERLEGERGLQLLLRGQFFYCPAVSYRWAALERPMWDERWRQVMDLVLYGRILLAGGSIELECSRVFRYRRHPASETQQNSLTTTRTDEENAACRELAAAAAERGWRRAARAGRVRLTVRLQSVVQALVALRHGRLRAAVAGLRAALRP